MKKLSLIPLLFVSFTQADTIHCKVLKVVDGNTISCVTEQKKRIDVRLYQIDAPELGQAYGLDAKKFLSDKLLNRKIEVETHGQDTAKRILGRLYTFRVGACYLPDGSMMEVGTCAVKNDINLDMISMGYAWYAPVKGEENTDYALSTGLAMNMQKGLWAQQNPIPPWNWRKQQQKKGTKK